MMVAHRHRCSKASRLFFSALYRTATFSSHPLTSGLDWVFVVVTETFEPQAFFSLAFSLLYMSELGVGSEGGSS